MAQNKDTNQKQAAPKRELPKLSSDGLKGLDDFLKKRKNIFLGVTLLLTAVFSYLMFNGQLSFASDDSTYVRNAYDFATKGKVSTFQGVLYPVFLSIFIKLWGVKIISLKMLSLFCLVVQTFFFYKTFEGKMPYYILFIGLFVASVNLHILQFGSYTFSEAFFLAMQSIFLYCFSRLLTKLNSENNTIAKAWPQWLLFGFTLLLLSITRNVALIAIGAVVVYFVAIKEFRNAIYAVASYLVFRLPYQLILKAIENPTKEDQLSKLMLKEYYHPEKGTEDFGGFIDRFFGNLNYYISVDFLKVLGLRSDEAKNILAQPSPPDDANGLLTLIFAGLAILSLVISFRKNKMVFFTMLYLGAILGLTFTILQTDWMQERLISIYVPFLFMGMVYGLNQLFIDRGLKFLQPILLCLAGLLVVIQFTGTAGASAKNSSGLKHYMKGETDYGYTPEKEAFVKCCEWAGTNVPDSVKVGVSLGGEAFCIAGKNIFSGVSAINSKDADSALAQLKKSKIDYLLVDQMRPAVARVYQVIAKKYPQKIQPVYVEGGNEQPTAVIKIVQ